jgi:hypothetical protein
MENTRHAGLYYIPLFKEFNIVKSPAEDYEEVILLNSIDF